METKKHKHSGDEKDNPVQSDNKSSHNNNAEKGFHIRDIDLDLQDVEGIGPTTVKKLNDADIRTVMDLAVASIDQLAVDINCSKDSAALFILAAQRLLRQYHILENEFVTADFVLEKRKSMLRCSTGSKSLDVAGWNRNSSCYRILWRIWFGQISSLFHFVCNGKAT